uniref:Uncharacterized protein n=1 Tax=Panagrellus redivivus TaxID=6233 RepID=A0A7E4UPL0_PANRE
METAPIFKEVWPRIAPPEINGATIIVTDCFQRLDEEAYGYTIILKAVTSSASLGCPLQLPENAEVRLINVEKEDENGFVKTYISSQHGELKEIREIGYTESNSNNKGYSMLLFFPNSRIDRLFFQMRDRDEDEF